MGCIKKNFLNVLELSDFQSVNIAAAYWMDHMAIVHILWQTRQVPEELFR